MNLQLQNIQHEDLRLPSNWKHASGNAIEVEEIPFFYDMVNKHSLTVLSGLIYGLIYELSQRFDEVVITDAQIGKILQRSRAQIQLSIKELKKKGLVLAVNVPQMRDKPCKDDHDHAYACYLTAKTNRMLVITSSPGSLKFVTYKTALKEKYSDREILTLELLKGGLDTDAIQDITGYKSKKSIERVMRKSNFTMEQKPDTTKHISKDINILNTATQPINPLQPKKYAPILIWQTAMYYSSLGWSVIPVNPMTKKPLIAWRTYQTRKPTMQELQKWFFNAWSHQVGVALVCGEVSGITVLDIDAVKHGLEAPNVTSELTAISGGGGLHVFFKYNGEKTVHNGQYYDILSNGSYVLLDPTPHKLGRNYTWEKEPTEKILSKLQIMPTMQKEQPIVASFVASPVKIKTNISVKEFTNKKVGERNNTIFRFSLISLSRFDEATAFDLVDKINDSFEVPLSAQEIDRTFKSAMRYVRGKNKYSRRELYQSRSL